MYPREVMSVVHELFGHTMYILNRIEQNTQCHVFSILLLNHAFIDLLFALQAVFIDKSH